MSTPDREAQASASRGRALLLNKSYLKAGVPIRLTSALYPVRISTADDAVMLGGRDWLNDLLPTGYTGRVLGQGVPAATENCLLCHAGTLRGHVVLGLGNSHVDAQLPVDATLIDEKKLDALEPTNEEREVFEAWKQYQLGVLPYSRATTPGTIAALYFTGYFFAHRRADTLEWVDEPLYPMLETPPPETDVPAWWLLKKKSCLYYGCELTGDFTRSLMQFMTVPGNSGADIREAEADFADVLAYLNTLEPPRYPGRINATLAAQGQQVFEDHCDGCHGTYGERPSYPNKVISLKKVGTDPARSEFMHTLQFAKHYGETWYGEKSKLEATDGYLAPPLDGIWATAPYLHNGSVPTLDAVLDPSLRPTFFVRSRDSTTYDLGRVGWEYEVVSNGQSPDTYDTTRYGKGNQGHTFGAVLTPLERRQVLEYLKTL
ncbi:MAG: hypothetical protein JNK82_24985 [Myxococcaceae bacterium]|nr:hypothetical protein [Myxococcaceae bacterium]